MICRAILLANAIATGILGLRSNIHDSQLPSGIVRRPSQVNRDIAPIIRRRRIYFAASALGGSVRDP